MEKKILANCIWKPIFSAVMTATFTALFGSGKLESIIIALVLGTLSGLSVYKDVKKALSDKNKEGAK